MSISLGSLMREKEVYDDRGLSATHTFDNIIASDENIKDAQIMAGKGGDVRYWLIKILCKDNRIPENPYDDEQVDP